MLSHRSARGHGPHALAGGAAPAIDLVDHVADDAAVVRHNLDDVADGRTAAACREIYHAVLLGDACDRGLGVLHQVTEALDGVLIGGEDLGAAVEDGAVGRGPADHRGADAHGAVVPGRGAGGHDHAVVVEVRPGA